MSFQPSKWYRVTKKRACAVCSHPDWCTYSSDGASCCMRVQSEKVMRNGGYLHRPDGVFIAPVPVRKAIEEPKPDFAALWDRYSNQTDAQHLDGFAMSLGVDTDALKAIGCAWAEYAWAFPMRDEWGAVIGIRLRNGEGKKWSVKGSKSGLFYSPETEDRTLWITEGPTDTAAAMSIGLHAVGRPSCLGQEGMLAAYIKGHRVKRVVIVADNDEPGLRGAAKLQKELKISSCVWCPPVKDLREFVNLGGDLALIRASTKDLTMRAA